MNDEATHPHSRIARHVRNISNYEGITEGQASVLRAAAKALESVTVQTKGDREALKAVLDPLKDVEMDEYDDASLLIADAVLTAGFRRSPTADRKALTTIRDAYASHLDNYKEHADVFIAAVGEALNGVVDSDGEFRS